ncbi:uncharacterized protein [Euphorbia lathyris]|uniref:uncharacterized protein n=1 Tax=Euphorbia lathyris TaxID=212925 RepID=UPI0033140159
MVDELSYYSVLGVTSDSSAHYIKQAYRRLAMQWNPDRRTRSPSHEIKFQQIQQAYSVLSDEKKKHYMIWNCMKKEKMRDILI